MDHIIFVKINRLERISSKKTRQLLIQTQHPMSHQKQTNETKMKDGNEKV